MTPSSPVHVFDHLDGLFCCDGVPLDEVAAALGTPCYVYGARVVRERYQALAGALGPVPHALHYALKANSTMAIVRFVRSLGAKVDANSGGEVELALRAGYTPAEIVFTGVGKTPAELELAVRLGLKTINAESPGELARIDEIAQARGTRARVALRVNPDIDARSHPHISTGLKRNKFGVALESAFDVCLDAARRPGLHLVGLHAHIGSQITTLAPLADAAGTLTALAQRLASAGVTLEHLDLGGGLGISYDGQQVPDVADYAAALVAATRGSGCSLILEPGRWLVGPAGVLVATVVDVKVHPGARRFVVLDAGMTDLLRPALYGAFHRIVPLRREEGRRDVTCDVVGPVCESSDTFGVDRQLPDPRPGDRVAILDTGAYGAVMASNYNRRGTPAEALVDGGRWQVIRRRQTLDDLLVCES
jgi:diaminopimelate decarboxylase